MGHLIAEGYLGPRDFTYSNTKPELIDDFVHCCEQVFGITPFIEPASGSRGAVAHLCRGDALDVLHYLGMNGKSDTKEIPWAIMQSTRAHVCEYLRAYWEGDGWFNTARRYAGCDSKSLRLMRQTHTLLLKLGIVGRLIQHKDWGVNKTIGYGIQITGSYAEMLAQTIGYISQVYEEIFRSKGWTGPTRTSKWDLVPFFGVELPPDTIAQPVRLFKDVGKLPVADLVVPNGHEFVANGFVAHNCSDTEYLLNIPKEATPADIRERVELLHFGRCRSCGRRVLDIRHDWLAIPQNAERWGDRVKAQLPNDFCILQGQRAGKSVATAMYCTYILHRYLILADPAAYFGLMADVGALYGTFVSVGLEQVASNLWQPFTDMIGTSPWFKAYHALLKDAGKDQGQEIFVQRDTYLWYRHKRLGLSYRASDQRRLRGKTRVFAAIDELSWLRKGKLGGRGDEESMQLSGPGVIRALNNSLMSVRMASRDRRGQGQQAVIDAYLMTISSPSSKLDTMMMRAAGAPRAPRRYFVKRATWESNPKYTEESLREEVGDMSEAQYQCVAPDTLVSTGQGLRQAGELCHDLGVHVSNIALNSNSRKGLFESEYVVRNKPSKTVVVETKHGLKVSCTKDQEVLTLSSDLTLRWISARNLVPGVHVVVGNKIFWPTKLPYWDFKPVYHQNSVRTTIPNAMTMGLARFLGYHASGGSLSRTNYALGFSVTDREVAGDYLRLLNKLFKLNKELDTVGKERMKLATKDSYRVQLYRRDVYDWMHVIGADGNSHTKKVPWVILQSPRRFVIEFLRGLFEGDGSISTSQTKQATWLGSVTLELASEDLLRQTQILLLQLDILSSLNVSKGGHRLVISGIHRDRFIELVGFISERKRGYRAAGTTKSHSLTLTIPGRLIIRMPGRPHKVVKRKRPRRIKLHRLHELDSVYLESLSDSDRKRISILKSCLTSPVRSVSAGPTVETCDFAIPDSRRFIANGLVVHNCDFACNPPYSDSPWWQDKAELLGLCVPEKLAVRIWSGSSETQADELGATYQWLYYKIAQTVRDRYTPRVLALDAGEKSCSFSWCTAHLDKDVVQIDDVGELAPEEGYRIHFGLMWTHLIVPLVKALRFEHVVWDRWESSRYVADLRTEYRVRAEQFSATYRDARALRTDMRNGRVRFPPPEVDLDMNASLPVRAKTPRAHLLYQVMTVRDPGHAIPIKPDGGTDDSFRCLLLAHATIVANRDLYRHVKRELRGPSAVPVVGVCSTLHGRSRGTVSPGGVVLGQNGAALGLMPRRRSYV
jgi:intein/homing endonuclease